MHVRASILVTLLVACGGSSSEPPATPTTAMPVAPSASAAPAASAAPTATPAPAVAAAPAIPAASAAPAAPAAGCKTVEWNKPTTLSGKAVKASGTDGSGKAEKYVALEVAAPICGPDGKPTTRIQLVPLDATNSYASLAKLEGKTISVTGSPGAAGTAHHHEAIILDVKKVE